MKTTGWFLAGIAALSLGGFGLSAEQAEPSKPTYTKDVAPILFRNCTSCHRPGEIAPMSLLTYDDVRPHAKDIRDEVSEGHMPPWHAAAPKGTFLNERGLTPEERDVLVRWVATGAPKGDPKDLPPTPVYPDGWAMGKPDVVFEMQEEYSVPAEGVIEYRSFYIPTNFTEAKWIQAIELRPGNREVVHHALAFYRATPDMKRPPVLRPNRDQMTLPPPAKQGNRPQREDQTPLWPAGCSLMWPRPKGASMLPDSYGITPQDLQDTLAKQGTTLQTGDVGLIRTGRTQVFYDKDANKYLLNSPGITLEAAKWLIDDRQAMTLGADNIGLEAISALAQDNWVPVHTYLEAERGVTIIEVLDLEALSRDKVYEFVFIGAPLKLRGATGAPMRPLAIPVR